MWDGYEHKQMRKRKRVENIMKRKNSEIEKDEEGEYTEEERTN